jgi:hypothetical protein
MVTIQTFHVGYDSLEDAIVAYTGSMPDSLASVLAPIVLPDADGSKVRLGSLWERQPAVVVFLRHYG